VILETAKYIFSGEAGNKISEVVDINFSGISLPYPTHKVTTQAGSGYPLQSFCPTYKVKTAKRIFASIPNAA